MNIYAIRTTHAYNTTIYINILIDKYMGVPGYAVNIPIYYCNQATITQHMQGQARVAFAYHVELTRKVGMLTTVIIIIIIIIIIVVSVVVVVLILLLLWLVVVAKTII